MLHVRPLSEEGPTVERVHAFIDPTSKRRGKHHETYLSDIRRADPGEVEDDRQAVDDVAAGGCQRDPPALAGCRDLLYGHADHVQ